MPSIRVRFRARLSRSARMISCGATAAAVLGSLLVLAPQAAAEADRAERAEVSEAVGTTYYVDASGGDDAASGLDEGQAWQSLDRVNETTFEPGDRILLRSGEQWSGQLWPKGSGAAGTPITIDSYGDGPKPRIDGEGEVAEAVRLFNQEHWEIRNLDVSNEVPVGSVPGENLGDLRGIGVLGDNGQTLSHFVIDSVDVHDVSGEIKWIGGNPGNNSPGVTWGTGWDRSKNTGGIIFLTSVPDIADPGDPTILNGITVQNSTVKNTSFSNIAVKQYTGDAPGAVTTGWGERRTENDSRFTPHTDVTIRGNYLTQADADFGANGVYLTNVRGGLVEHNVIDRVGVSGVETFAADQVTVQFNEISGTRSAQGSADGNGMDPDIATTNQLFQYNYLHGNEDGILLCACRSGVNFGSAVVRYNVVVNSERWNLHMSQQSGSFAEVYHNTFYSTDAPNMVSGGVGGRVELRNNLFVSPRPVSFLQNSNVTYDNNGYSPGLTVPSSDSAAVVGEPRFLDPDVSGPHGDEHTGPILETARGFALTPESVFVNAAGDMADRGDRDLLGTPVPTGPAADIGAFEYTTPPGQTWETVSGLVRNQYEVPVSGAQVSVTVDGETHSATTEDDGFYRITEVPFADDAPVTATAEGYDDYSATITVSPGSAVRHDFEMTAQFSTGTLTGVVVDEQANPVPGATVTVTVDDTPVAAEQSGADGRFAVTGVEADTELTVTASIGEHTGFPRGGVSVTPTAIVDVGALYIRSSGTEEWVSETFDDLPTGPLADGTQGWRVVSVGNAVDVVEVPSATDKSVRLHRTTGQGDPAGTNLARVFDTPLEGLVRIDGRVMRDDDQAGWFGLPYVYNADGQQAISVAFARGDILAFNGGSAQTIGQYTRGKWYDISLTVDTIGQRFDLDIDGERVLSDATFRTRMDGVARIAWYANGGERGAVHVDDVFVTQGEAFTPGDDDGNLLDDLYAEGKLERRHYNKLRTQLAVADRAAGHGRIEESDAALDRFIGFANEIDDEETREQLTQFAEALRAEWSSAKGGEN
ncbi:carboxypeptidase regulatory-like domain-containing protein [Phytoactinopolyspora mesophila]|uniref:FIMAH domain-containing protein n=1 Tax=Phytoactinopolyspora mesophila TaxID=2650750 RepID=A0A7K3M864_9ACTN|nr:carboxypeptidase regulatory-like domain-containing protein [Phytoactinopolyspora mesophila]NDL59454.1 hypothetical protein [Phytoactinopolyspora mesophila]